MILYIGLKGGLPVWGVGNMFQVECNLDSVDTYIGNGIHSPFPEAAASVEKTLGIPAWFAKIIVYTRLQKRGRNYENFWDCPGVLEGLKATEKEATLVAAHPFWEARFAHELCGQKIDRRGFMTKPQRNFEIEKSFRVLVKKSPFAKYFL